MFDGLEHDGAASLRVILLPATTDNIWRHGYVRAGWHVVRVCPCHFGQRITMPFESRERAERALQALDFDAKRYVGQ